MWRLVPPQRKLHRAATGSKKNYMVQLPVPRKTTLCRYRFQEKLHYAATGSKKYYMVQLPVPRKTTLCSYRFQEKLHGAATGSTKNYMVQLPVPVQRKMHCVATSQTAETYRADIDFIRHMSGLAMWNNARDPLSARCTVSETKRAIASSRKGDLGPTPDRLPVRITCRVTFLHKVLPKFPKSAV